VLSDDERWITDSSRQRDIVERVVGADGVANSQLTVCAQAQTSKISLNPLVEILIVSSDGTLISRYQFLIVEECGVCINEVVCEINKLTATHSVNMHARSVLPIVYIGTLRACQQISADASQSVWAD